MAAFPIRFGNRTTGLWAVFALLACLLIAPHSPAQTAGGVTVQADVLTKRLPLGEQAQLVVRVINGRVEALPDSVPVEGLTIRRSPRIEQKMEFDAGGSRTEYHIYYVVEASRAGDFTIPAITVRVDGRDYTTEPKALTVYERDPSDPALDASRPYFANLECQSREIWAGQVVPLTLAIYVRGARSINDVGPPLLRHDAFVFAYDRSYALDGVDLDGITFTTAKRPASVFGLTPGTYSVGPAEIQVAMLDESSPFGRMPGFFQSFTARTLRTNPLNLTVKPLPETGKPAHFKGAVGNFTVTLKASPLTVAVGDPITLDFEVTGPGNYELLEAPVLLEADLSDWRTYDARKQIDTEAFSDGVSPGRATFTQIVMPQAQVAAVPAFELSFFNPETGAYENRRTDPIAIRVTPDTRPAGSAPAGVAIPANGAATAAAPGSGFIVEEAATPEAQYNDIVHIRTTPPRWQPLPVAITSRPGFWVGQIIPSIALFTLIGLGWIRRRRSTARDSGKTGPSLTFKAALASVESARTQADFLRAVLRAIDRWMAEAGSQNAASLPDDLRQALANQRTQAQNRLYGASTEALLNQAPDPTERTAVLRLLSALRRHLP